MKTCTYDPLYRLLSATGKERGLWQDTIPWQEWDTTAPNNVIRGYVEVYEYDKVGFMTSLNHTAANNSYQYTRSFASSGANHLASMTSGSNTFAFSYDESGNLTSGNGNHYYEWDYRNQLQRFYVAASSSGTKSVDAYYLYDSAGNRTKKFILNQTGTEADITVYYGAMEVRYKKVVVNSDISSTYTDLSATIKIEEGGQCVATFQTGSHPDEFNVDYFTYSDHLGSSTLLIRSNGEIISREFYTPFGETAYRTSPKSRYRYCGKEKDGESGLYYYGARYYAAWLCRFVSVDPLAEKYAQLSSYNYASNTPVTWKDIDGMQTPNQVESQKAEPPKRAPIFSLKGDQIGWVTGVDTVYLADDKAAKSIGDIENQTIDGEKAGNLKLTEIDTLENLRAIIDYVVTEDKKDGRREYGGIVGVDSNGLTLIAKIKPGKDISQTIGEVGAIDFNTLDDENQESNYSQMVNIYYFFHSHPSAVTKKSSGFDSEGVVGSKLGGSRIVNNEPSLADRTKYLNFEKVETKNPEAKSKIFHIRKFDLIINPSSSEVIVYSGSSNFTRIKFKNL